MFEGSISIRTATVEDLDDLLEIEHSCYQHPWSRQHFIDEFNNPASSIDVAMAGQRLAGYICTWLVCGEMQIQNLATSPRHRRLGIGQSLLEYVIERGRQQGMVSAWLEVRETNQAAIGLYRGRDFIINGRRKKYYQDGEDALLLSRNFE